MPGIKAITTDRPTGAAFVGQPAGPPPVGVA